MRARRFIQVAVSSALLLAIAACGNAEMTTIQPTPSGTGTASGEFGAGCAAVPTDPANPGSFEAMAKAPVATAAAGNPMLATLVTAVAKANLTDSLNSAKDITVFAPTNDAFSKIPAADMEKVLADKATLTKILTYHVVPGRVAPDQLAGTHKTLQGQDLTVTGNGTDFKVDGTASVVCGNVQTRNAIVYIIDSVLMPS